MTSTASLDPKQNFTLVILQTELERVRFLIRSFLRARIAKVRTALATNVSLPPPSRWARSRPAYVRPG